MLEEALPLEVVTSTENDRRQNQIEEQVIVETYGFSRRRHDDESH